jgi:hypothetical protein
MASRRRWLQFSLRGFLVVMTVGCIWLGWRVDRAQKRGRAIDAIMKAGGSGYYRAPEKPVFLSTGPENHFWFDLTSTQVDIFLDMPLNAAIGSQLSRIYGINHLNISASKTTEADLRHLEQTDARTIFIWDADISTEARERLRRTSPNIRITFLETPSLGFSF